MFIVIGWVATYSKHGLLVFYYLPKFTEQLEVDGRICAWRQQCHNWTTLNWSTTFKECSKYSVYDWSHVMHIYKCCLGSKWSSPIGWWDKKSLPPSCHGRPAFPDSHDIHNEFLTLWRHDTCLALKSRWLERPRSWTWPKSSIQTYYRKVSPNFPLSSLWPTVAENGMPHVMQAWPWPRHDLIRKFNVKKSAKRSICVFYYRPF